MVWHLYMCEDELGQRRRGPRDLRRRRTGAARRCRARRSRRPSSSAPAPSGATRCAGRPQRHDPVRDERARGHRGRGIPLHPRPRRRRSGRARRLPGRAAGKPRSVTAAADASAAAPALERLRDELAALDLTLETPAAARGRAMRDELVGQVDDYLLPRLAQMDAPLLMVVGGSTGAGKSTLVNSLVGAEVSTVGVLRPTTRAPVLVCHPADVAWFEGDRILPALSRTSGAPAGPGGLQLVPTIALPEGVALLDAPDIDSVVEANRALAAQLLAAADSWLFVTTAARYADAVPWDMLHAARDRGTSLSLVLDRVPADAVDEISGHLRQMLAEHGLGETPVLVVRESALEEGLLPAAELAPVRAWLDDLAADAQARAGVVRRTLAGALESLPRRVAVVREAAAQQA